MISELIHSVSFYMEENNFAKKFTSAIWINSSFYSTEFINSYNVSGIEYYKSNSSTRFNNVPKIGVIGVY